MIISARPSPRIKTLLKGKSRVDLSDFEFHRLGRDALLHSLIKLGLRKGDRVIIPAYICDSTIKPLRFYGLDLEFIDVDKKLSLTINRLEKMIVNKKIKALVLVHYFGYSQETDEIIKLCHKFDVKLIEDACHSFLSQFKSNKKNLKGDAEIFSMRKNVPVVDGGAMRMNHLNTPSPEKNLKKGSTLIGDLRYLIIRLFEKIFTLLGINIYGLFFSYVKTSYRTKRINEIKNYDNMQRNISWQLSKYLGDDRYLRSSQRQIVKNYNQLSQALQNLGFRLLFDSLKDNDVPQACVIYDDSDGLVDFLRLNGIGAWRWPDNEMPEIVINNPSKFKNTILLDKKLTLIPIHQSLGNKQINYIVEVMTRWNK